jgi:hypothetical protein
MGAVSLLTRRAGQAARSIPARKCSILALSTS